MGKNSFKRSNQAFINPYNFVSADWTSTERQSASFGELSGVLHCRLRTVTPLAAPVFREKINDHNYYDFMRTPDGVPMIPGSSLRGPIRNVYEALTNSCFSTNKKEQFITKRAAMRESGKPGLLIRDENGNWRLYGAERHLVVIEEKEYAPFQNETFKNANKYSREKLQEIGQGTRVYYDILGRYESYKKGRMVPIGFVVDKLSTNNTGQKHSGFLCIGEVPPLDKDGKRQTNKHFESVFEKKEEIDIQIREQDIETIRYLLKQYNDPSVNHNASESKEIYKGVSTSIKNGVVPIWYRQEGNNIKFSLAAIGRIRFEREIGEMLGEKKKCRDRNCLCAACRLFGIIGDDKGISGRVRFTDATGNNLKDEDILKDVTLKELGAPKLSYVPFYAEKQSMTQTDSYDEKGVVLKGRKFYWHDLRNDIYRAPHQPNDKEKTKRNSTMDLVDKNKEFVFDVYYDRLTRQELEELKWILTLGENRENSDLCHKIGHGKPIGLGSIKIVIESNEKRVYSISEGYTIHSENTNDIKEGLFKTNQTEELLSILDTKNTKNINVSYPYIVNAKPNDNGTAPHQWFSHNWQPTKALAQPLPTIKQVVSGTRLYAYERENAADVNRKFNTCRIQVKITGVAKSGAIFFEDEGKKGTVSARELNGRVFKMGQIVSVSFNKEVTFDDGSKMRFYHLEQ